MSRTNWWSSSDNRNQKNRTRHPNANEPSLWRMQTRVRASMQMDLEMGRGVRKTQQRQARWPRRKGMMKEWKTPQRSLERERSLISGVFVLFLCVCSCVHLQHCQSTRWIYLTWHILLKCFLIGDRFHCKASNKGQGKPQDAGPKQTPCLLLPMVRPLSHIDFGQEMRTKNLKKVRELAQTDGIMYHLPTQKQLDTAMLVSQIFEVWLWLISSPKY